MRKAGLSGLFECPILSKRHDHLGRLRHDIDRLEHLRIGFEQHLRAGLRRVIRSRDLFPQATTGIFLLGGDIFD